MRPDIEKLGRARLSPALIVQTFAARLFNAASQLACKHSEYVDPTGLKGVRNWLSV
jgi:hypothetical protein